ncbi:MAG: MFS transporter [Nitrososphaerales archaeon]
MNDKAKSFIATSLAHFVNDGCGFIFPVIYPLLVSSYSISTLGIALLATLLNFSQVAASPFIGRKTDSSRNFSGLISLGIIMVGAGVAGYGISILFFRDNFLLMLLILWTTLAGLGTAFFHPISATILKEKFDSRSRGRMLGISGSIGSAGRAIFPLIVVLLITSYSISSLLMLSGVAIVSGIIVFLIMRNVHFLSNQKVNDEVSGSQQNAPTHFPMSILVRGIFPLLILSIARGAFAQGIIQFIPIYLNTIVHVQYGYGLGLSFTLMLAMGIIGQPLLGYLADRFGRRLIMGVANGGGVISMLMFLVYGNHYYSEILLAAFGLFTLSAYPLLFGLATDVAPEGAATVTGSLVWSVGNIGGSSIGPLLVGLLAQRYFLGSLTYAFYAMCAIGVFSVILLPLVKPAEYFHSYQANIRAGGQSDSGK